MLKLVSNNQENLETFAELKKYAFAINDLRECQYTLYSVMIMYECIYQEHEELKALLGVKYKHGN